MRQRLQVLLFESFYATYILTQRKFCLIEIEILLFTNISIILLA